MKSSSNLFHMATCQVKTYTDFNMNLTLGKLSVILHFFFFLFCTLENNFICSRALARVPLELLKLLLGASSLGDLEHIESHSLAQGPALSNCDNVSDLYIPETGGQVHRHVLVTLLKAIVLSDVMEIVPADDNGPLHLHLRHDTRQDPTSDGDVTSEGAFLVYVGTLNSLFRRLEA